MSRFSAIPPAKRLFPALLLMVLLTLITAFSAQHTPRHLQELRQWKAGSVVDEASVRAYGMEHCFAVTTIPDSIFRAMAGKTYRKYCNVPRSDLRYLRLLHRDAKGRIILGEMVCHRLVAKELTEIFRQLYENRYPIERMRLADVYGGDDNRSMVANNTSCFNFRKVAGTSRLSAHSRGMAVDINPLYNPYVRTRNGKLHVQPDEGKRYADRNVKSDYRLVRGDLCHRLFTAHGYTWGGAWRTAKDYQHFEK